MNETMSRDYAYYQAQMSQAQIEENAITEWLHIPPRDLAWEKTVERARNRDRRITWGDIQREARERAALNAYKAAVL